MDPLLEEIQSSLKIEEPAAEPTPAADPKPEPTAAADPAPASDPEPTPNPEPSASADPAPNADPVDPNADPKDPAASAEPDPAAEPDADPSPSIDITKILSEQSNGRITSKEDLEKILNERDEFKDRLDKSPVLDDYTTKLNAWRKEGYDTELFHVINDMPIDELSAEDKVKASLKLQNPEWDENDVNLFVKNKYGILDSEDDGYDESKVRYGKLQLDTDAKVADKELRELKDMTVYSEVDEQETLKQEGERQEQWKGGLPKISQEFKEVAFSLDKDNKQIFKYIPTPEQKARVMSAVQKAVINAPLAYNEEGVKAVNETIRKEFINQNINDIVRAAAKQAVSAQIEADIKKRNNPSGSQEPTPVVPQPVSAEEQTLETIDRMLG